MSFDEQLPIYSQLVSFLQVEIAKGNFKPGDKLPSRRDLATYYKVNPNTVQRAFKELEASGVIYTEGNLGSFVSKDEEKIKDLRQLLLKEATDAYLTQIKELGLSYEDMLAYIQSFVEKGEDGNA